MPIAATGEEGGEGGGVGGRKAYARYSRGGARGEGRSTAGA